MSKLREIAKKINKQYGVEMIVQSDLVPPIEKVPTMAQGFNYALYGGLPLGRVVTMSGKEHSGKTLGAFVMLASYQKYFPDKTCVFIDVEHSIDLEFQNRMTGIDLSKLIYVDTITLGGESVLDLILNLQESEDIGMIVVDSMGALMSNKRIDTELEKDLGMSGNMAKANGNFLKIMTPLVAQKKNILVLINQVSEEKLQTGAIKYNEPGGKQLGYAPSLKIRFGTRKFIDAKGNEISSGTDAEGFRLNFVITKNKVDDLRRGGGFATFKYDTGLDVLTDAVNIAVKCGYIKQAGAYFSILDLTKDKEEVIVLTVKDKDGKESKFECKFQGKTRLIEFMEKHKDFSDTWLKMMGDKLLDKGTEKVSLLDEEEVKALLEQEKSVMSLD